MKVVCAWCDQDKGEKEPRHGHWAYVITHCICDDCVKTELAKWTPNNKTEPTMTLDKIQKLHTGDEVLWTDPDNGMCTRMFKIRSIEIKDTDVVSIEDQDGSVVECFISELS